MDRTVLWRAALLQLLAVAALSAVLAVTLPDSFFDEWGWVSGPAAWLACAALTGKVLALPLAQTLTGAALAGFPSLIFVVLGAHWAGALVAVGLFALWCARLARDPELPAEVV